MKFINRLIDGIAVTGLFIASVLLSLSPIIIVLSIIFNFPPYITFGENSSSRIGVTDYSRGVPVTVDISASIPDTSVYIKNKNGNISYTIKEGSSWYENTNDSTVLHGDTIITEYGLHTNKNSDKLRVTDLDFGSGKAYIQPASRLQLFILSLPSILQSAVLAYCAWQLAMLLAFIQSGESFITRNYRRLSKTGWAIVGLYIAMFFYEIALKQFNSLYVSFSSTIPGYQQPLSIHATPENTIGITWLIAGCIILILASAFRKGSRLQHEQDLTI